MGIYSEKMLENQFKFFPILGSSIPCILSYVEILFSAMSMKVEWIKDHLLS